MRRMVILAVLSLLSAQGLVMPVPARADQQYEDCIDTAQQRHTTCVESSQSRFGETLCWAEYGWAKVGCVISAAVRMFSD